MNNSVFNNMGCGIAIKNDPVIQGSGNEIYNNNLEKLCPSPFELPGNTQRQQKSTIVEQVAVGVDMSMRRQNNKNILPVYKILFLGEGGVGIYFVAFN
jgi:hypothetical protein